MDDQSMSGIKNLRRMEQFRKPLESDIELDEKILHVEYKANHMKAVDEKGNLYKVELDFPEPFDDDLPSSNLSEIEMYLTKQYLGLMHLEREIYKLSNGLEDTKPFAYYLNNYAHSHMNASKGKEGSQVKAVKSIRYVGEEQHRYTPLPEEKGGNNGGGMSLFH